MFCEQWVILIGLLLLCFNVLEEQRRLAEQLKEMKLIRDQFQKDIQSMRAEQRQLLAIQR